MMIIVVTMVMLKYVFYSNRVVVLLSKVTPRFFSVQDVIDNVDAEETSSSGGSEKL